MKCPGCETNWKYRDGMKCRCGYRFVFNPKSDGITDGKFNAAIRHADKNGTIHYTKDQLFTSYCKKLAPSRVGPFIVGAILLVILAALVYSEIYPVAAIIGVFLCFIIASLFRGKVESKDFHRHLKIWIEKKGTPERMVTEPTLHSPPPEWNDADIYDYGVEKLLIVQRKIMVDMFVLNDFHAEQRCLVMSAGGYPDYILPRAKKAISDNPDLPVYYLHDATEEGVESSERFRSSGILGDTIRNFIPLGLFPEECRKIPLLKPALPKNISAGVAVTLIPYTLLSDLAGRSMETMTPFSSILSDPASAADISFG